MTELKTENVEEKKAKPDWVKMKPAEVESLVLDLAKKGETPAKIGLILRDMHGIPKTKLISKRISQILSENNIKVKTEKESMEDKIKNLQAHIAKNTHDPAASRSLTKKLWAIRKLN